VATKPDGRPSRGLGQAEIVERVRSIAAEVGAAETSSESFRDESWVRLPAAALPGIFPRLRDDDALAFDMLMDVTCVHLPRRPLPLGEFDVVYHLVSLRRGHRIRLKVACADPEVGVASATSTWPGADFMEREAYDMFGVRFAGHPDLRRILMGDDYEGWPLRKDFPYRGH
jgi:NADH/F420H2 dehydrogenase subunit C